MVTRRDFLKTMSMASAGSYNLYLSYILAASAYFLPTFAMSFPPCYLCLLSLILLDAPAFDNLFFSTGLVCPSFRPKLRA